MSTRLQTGIGLLAATVLLLSGSAGFAQQAEDAKSLVRQAYEKTQSASTVEDFTGIIQQLELAREGELSDRLKEYAANLLGWTHNRRGEAYAEQAGELAKNGDLDGAAEKDTLAVADFDKALEYDPDYWKAIHNRGVSLAMAGRYQEALDDFSRVVRLRSNYTNAWFNRAEIYFELGSFREAVSDYDRAIRLDSEDFGAYTSRGHAHFQLREFREALSDYNQAIRLQPESADAYANRADAYRSLGMWSESVRDYRRALELDNKLGRAWQGAAWLMATCPVDRMRYADRAIQSAKFAIQVDGESDYRYLDTLAAAYANNNQFDEAQEALQKAIDIAPEGETGLLRQRLELYGQGRPYRQGMFDAEE